MSTDKDDSRNYQTNEADAIDFVKDLHPHGFIFDKPNKKTREALGLSNKDIWKWERKPDIVVGKP